MNDLVFRTGEATVFASEGQYTDAMPEVVIGRADGPVGTAFATMMGQSAGHTRMFVVRDCNQMVKPAAMMTSKVTIDSAEYITIFGSIVQSATADAILDCVIDGTIPKSAANDLVMIITIWLDPRVPTHDKLDKKELFKNNYEATKIAIKRAMKNEPSIDELIANRNKISHCMVNL